MSSQLMRVDATARLMEVATEEMERHGVTISKDCDQSFESLWRTSRQRLDAESDRLEEAAANIRKLIDVMNEEVRAAGLNELSEWSLTKALGRLCPLFPFC